MKIATALILAGTLAGCAHPLTLYPQGGGQAGTGTANEAGKKVTISVNGTTYSGTYVHDGGSVVPTSNYGTATAYSGARSATAYGSSYGTAYVPGSGNGRILAASPAGDTIRCEFIYKAGGGLGQCDDSAGKRYDLKIE